VARKLVVEARNKPPVEGDSNIALANSRIIITFWSVITYITETPSNLVCCLEMILVFCGVKMALRTEEFNGIAIASGKQK